MLGASGYLISGLYDTAILFDKPMLQKVFRAGMLLTAAPYPFLFISHETALPPMLAWILLPCISILAALLIYSVFLEIPLADVEAGTLYRKGTYRLSRHPGFLWYTGINILIAIYFLDGSIILLCGALTVCNLALIIIEDRFLFPRMFAGYEDYRKQTPFLFSINLVLHRRNLR